MILLKNLKNDIYSAKIKNVDDNIPDTTNLDTNKTLKF